MHPHPSIIRNTLISDAGIEKILSMPECNETYISITDILQKFEDIKKFASEIHTEIHLVKPVLKCLGFSYESKPKFYEEHVKPPDIALFSTEDERLKDSKVWGTKDYYDNTLGILLIKRYGRTLQKGISGFYLEFENRIPLFQILYILKKTKTPWGILTNGRNWILIKRPVNSENRIIELDIEYPSARNDFKPLHLFYNIFSQIGLSKTIPELLEDERGSLIDLLRVKKEALIRGIKGLKKRVDIYPVVSETYHDIFKDGSLPATEEYLKEKDIMLNLKGNEETNIVNPYNAPDVFFYLFSMKGKQTEIDIQGIIDILFEQKRQTKESLLTLKILDMTPNFGTITTQLIEGLAYLSFVLPYADKNTFTTEWEDEQALKRYILDTTLFGVERSHIALDMFQDAIVRRFGSNARHYRLGNPLIGMSLKDIANHVDMKNQMGLFTRNPMDVLSDLKDMFRQYYSFSDRIKEDVEERSHLEPRLNIYLQRIRDVMDIITSTYFIKTIDNRKIQDMLFNLDGDEAFWESQRTKGWFIEAKGIAKRNGFFHFEIEFPFLLNNAFDLIFVQPSLTYLWEEEFPVIELTKAYIKRGMSYLKKDGRFIIIADRYQDAIISEVEGSKKYKTERMDNLVVLSIKHIG